VKAVGYIRVSTSEQADEWHSLAAQQAKLAAYAQLYDVELVTVEVDAGLSAKAMERPALQRSLAMLKSGQAEALLVCKLDRLTRSVKDLGFLVDAYFAHGKYTLMSVSEQFDTRSAAGRLVLNALASVAQWERETIGERTREVMQHMKRAGQVYSRPCLTDGAAINRMRELRAEGMAYRGIAQQLAAEGHQTARGGQWDESTVRKFLMRGAKHA
jgi:site-specific DNA recombinase